MKSKFDDEIKNIVIQMHEIEMDSIPCNDTLAETYTLSDTFYKKMNKLLIKTNRKELIHSVIRYALTAAVALIIVCGLTNPTIVTEAYKEIVSWFEDHVNFQFKEEIGDVDIPEYELSYVPEGYEMVREEMLKIQEEIRKNKKFTFLVEKILHISFIR